MSFTSNLTLALTIANTVMLARVLHTNRRILMNDAEQRQALQGLSDTIDTAVSTLTDVGAQLDKGLTEVATEVQGLQDKIASNGQSSPEFDALLTSLKGKVSNLGGVATALKAQTQKLDDMNVDVPAAPAGGDSGTGSQSGSGDGSGGAPTGGDTSGQTGTGDGSGSTSNPPSLVDDAFVAVGSTRISDGLVQTDETLAAAVAAWNTAHPDHPITSAGSGDTL